jgi:hypothetical protein
MKDAKQIRLLEPGRQSTDLLKVNIRVTFRSLTYLLFLIFLAIRCTLYHLVADHGADQY